MRDRPRYPGHLDAHPLIRFDWTKGMVDHWYLGTVKLRRCLIRACIKRIVLRKLLIYGSTAMLGCAYVDLSTYMPTFLYLQSSMWHQYVLFFHVFLKIPVVVVVVLYIIYHNLWANMPAHTTYFTRTHVHVRRQQVIEIYRPKPVGIMA